MGNFKKCLSFIHHKLLKNDSFTIISNNCWGGIIYKYFGIKFQTPTVGMYFYADEYLKFLSNLNYYLSLDMDVKEANSSKYYEEICRRGQNPLIGWLDDVEIVLLHYKDPKEAREKWDYRKKRINYDRLVVKFNDQNLCNDSHIKRFFELDYKNKICFLGKKYPNKNAYYFKCFKNNGFVVSDTKMRYWRRYFNVISYLNRI